MRLADDFYRTLAEWTAKDVRPVEAEADRAWLAALWQEYADDQERLERERQAREKEFGLDLGPPYPKPQMPQVNHGELFCTLYGVKIKVNDSLSPGTYALVPLKDGLTE